MKRYFVQLFHIFIIGSLFLYVGIRRTEIPKFLFQILVVTGILIFLFHGYKAYRHLVKGESAWVNYIHMFLIAPLLVYIGYQQEETKRFAFEILLMLAFTSIGYHGYYLITSEK